MFSSVRLDSCCYKWCEQEIHMLLCDNDACAITIIPNKAQHTYRLQQTYTIVYSNYGDTVYMLQLPQ